MPSAILPVPISESEQSFIDHVVAEGKYSSAVDFVSALIQEARKKATIARINAKLKEGLACPERIELTPEFWQNERRRLDEFIRSEGLE
jgi:Arc/MetJ-type ribon-helix-helix transcriptional regulator